MQSCTYNIQVLMFQFIPMVREAFPITSFIPDRGRREMEALGNSTAVTCILNHEREKGEKKFLKSGFNKSKWTQNKIQISVKHNLPPERILTLRCCIWHYQAQISHGQSNQGNAPSSSPTSLATGKQWSVQLPLTVPGSLELCVSGLGNVMDTESARRWYLTWDMAALFQVSLLVMARAELIGSISEVRWTLIWCTMLSSSLMTLL